MTTSALNNLWTYIQGLTLLPSERDWLAGKLMEPTAEEIETKRQQELVKDSLYRALDEYEVSIREGKKRTTIDEFLEELENEGIA